MGFYRLTEPPPAVRRFAGTDEALVFDAVWNETHLLTDALAAILVELGSGPRSVADLARTTFANDFEPSEIEAFLANLEKLKLVAHCGD